MAREREEEIGKRIEKGISMRIIRHTGIVLISTLVRAQEYGRMKRKRTPIVK